MRRAVLVLLAAVASTGCGSQAVEELPPAATPARAPALTAQPAGRVVPSARAPDALVAAGRAPRTAVRSGRRLAVLDPRARTLELRDPQSGRRVARTSAGVGPTHVLAVSDRLYVTDTQGGALLVFATRPELALVRRVDLPGGPYGLAVDLARHRLWVTLTARNELVSLPANGRPRPLVRLATVRQPDVVATDSTRGIVIVAGRAAGVVQVVGARQAYPEDEG